MIPVTVTSGADEPRIATIRLGAILINGSRSRITGRWEAYAVRYDSGLSVRASAAMPDDAVRDVLDRLEALRDDLTAALREAGRGGAELDAFTSMDGEEMMPTEGDR